MKHKKLKIALIASVAAVFILIASLSVYAFFTTRVYVYTDTGKEVAQVGMNLQLLFGKLEGVQEGTDLKIPNYPVVAADGTVVTATTATGETYPATIPTGNGQYLRYNDGVSTGQITTYDPDAPWGTAQNPYIISEARHLQNLSALQSVGYFDLLYIANNFADDGSYISGGASIPYFLICNIDGSPVTIDGTDLGTIKPIGSAEHPFIGVIGGAFTTTKTDTNGTTTLTTPVGADKTSEVSTIHGFKIQTNTNQVDVGLFGYVGYLGTEPTENVTTDSTFNGVVSVVQNLLLSDVQVVVNNPSVAEVVSELLGHVFNSHKFTFTGNGEDVTPGVPPHEDHHIGIFAGHVSYAHANYISVYYSDDENVAIDLTHTGTNYHSSTGIVGFMHNMNSPVKNQGTDTAVTGHCMVSYGGISSSGINITPDTEGAGGGDTSGSGRGYVVARTLYENCHFIQTNQAMFERIWKFTLDGNVYYGPMFYATTSGNTTTYTNQNGDKKVTISNGTATEEGGKSYTSYAIRTGTADAGYVYTFYNAENPNGVVFVPNNNPNRTDDAGARMPLNLEIPQSIWQYVLTKPVDDNGTPIEDRGQWVWTDAVLVKQTGENTYVLTETLFGNTFPVTVNGSKATITGTSVTIENIIILRTDGKYYARNAEGNWVVPEFFQEKPLLIANATYMTGVSLCESSEKSKGKKYFYDGVFTFALSHVEDAIESTWENESPDQIVIGPNQNDQWKESLKEGFYGVVAYIKPITSLEEFKEIATSNTPIFIGYRGYTGTEWQGNSLHMMSLLESPVDPTTWDMFSNDFYQASSNTKNFFDDTECDALYRSLDDYITNSNEAELSFAYSRQNLSNVELAQYLVDNRDNLQVLNLEASTNLSTLINKYMIVPSAQGSGDAMTFSFSQGEIKLGLTRSEATAPWYADWIFEIISRYNYSLYPGTTAPPNKTTTISRIDVNYTYTWDHWANVQITNGSEEFTIKYTHRDGTERYVAYNSADYFSSRGNASSVYFYTIEAMSTVKSGQVVFEPVGGINTDNTFNADEYVLWPQAVMHQNGTYDGFANISAPSNTALTGATLNATATKTDGDLYNTYRLLKVNDLYNADNGWQDGYGNQLSNFNMRKKFTMQKAVDFNVSLNIPLLGIGNVGANDNTILAPIGRGGEMANIPTGSIAFRINETTEVGSSIYVVVSVPVSRFYDGASEESLTPDWDYYLGLWQTQDVVEDDWGYNIISQTSAIQKFELPRSRPYDPETATVANSEYILVEYGGTTYRCYLNGDRVLVAYRFTVYEAGTYILGTAVGESGLWSGIDYSYPMEIVYCAADGTASAGLDGTIGSVTGSLDYVYDYNNTIVHVRDYAAGEAPSTTTRDYNYYYNSRIVTHTVNDTTAINALKFCPYRYIADERSKFSLLASNPDLVNGKHVGPDPDDLTEGTLTSSGGG